MSSPDDIPKTSKPRARKRQNSSRSSSESISQPLTPPVHLGERPSTSNGHESGHSRHSSGQLGNHHSSRPNTGHSGPTGARSSISGRSSHGGQRPPTNMRDRLLVSNANAMARELSVSELDETTTSSSSPHMNGHGHTTDDQQSGLSNGSRRAKKKKKKSNRNRASFDADLIGWTGAFPKLSTASCHLDSNPDLDLQTSDELRARCRRGLMVFPREAQGSEGAAESAQPAAEPTLNPQPHQQQQQSLATSPSPMSSPIESSLSPNSELNRNMTPGPEPEPGLVPEPEQPTQPEPPTTLATTTSTNLTATTTTTTARNTSNCDATATTTATATATATAATPSASGRPCVSPRTAIGRETELDNQEKSDDKEQKQQPPSEEAQQQAVQKTQIAAPAADPKDASSSSVSGSSKRQGSPIENQAKKKDAKEKAVKEEEPTSPPSKRYKKSKIWAPARPPTPMRPRSLSLDIQDAARKLARSIFRFKSQESLTELRYKTEELDSKEAIKKKSPQINLKPKSPLPTVDKPVLPPPIVAKQKSPPLAEVKPEPPSNNLSTLKLKATDEFYRLPFTYGWKRELVLPSKGNPKRRTGDVFFISPSGRKLRSREDIMPLLEGELTIEHFCFQRLAQEAGPEFELVRRATPSVVRSKFQETVLVYPQSLAEQPVTGKRVPKPKVPKGASPPSEGWTATTAVKGKSRVLASSSNGNSSAGSSGASSSRKRSTLSKQPSKMSSSDAPPGCVQCLAPLQGSTCSNCSMTWKPGKEKESQITEAAVEPPAPLAKQQPPVAEEGEDTLDSQDNEDTASAGSVMEIGEEIELPGQMPPAQLFDEQQEQIPFREMEVVVIGGRKAIAIAASPPRPRVKLVPRLPDLTSYDRIYRKRIQDKRLGQTLAIGLNDAHIGMNVLTAVMKTMNMKERTVVSQVCSTWATVSRDNRVWNRVILRDTHIKSWKQLLLEMARHRTRELDMMGVRMTDPKIRHSGEMRILKSLRVLRTDATTNEFLKLIQCNLPQLVELRTTCVSNQLHLARLERMKKLRVLRINMTHPKAHAHFINTVGNLKLLTELSLRGVTNLNNLDVTDLKRLTRLEVLSLGSCENLNHVKLGREVLPYLKGLHTIRIENDYRAMAMFPVDEIMRGVAHAGGVRRLELINVDVDSGFGQLLASCSTVAHLLLTPKCLHNTATMTNAVMQAISDNANHLLVFRLGLVTQLLSATENLYKGTNKNVIPVQRPVPGIPESDPLNRCCPEDGCQEEDHGQCVAFLPVERLESILHEMMPKGCLSVAKVAMSDTTKMQFLAPGVSEST